VFIVVGIPLLEAAGLAVVGMKDPDVTGAVVPPRTGLLVGKVVVGVPEVTGASDIIVVGASMVEFVDSDGAGDKVEFIDSDGA